MKNFQKANQDNVKLLVKYNYGDKKNEKGVEIPIAKFPYNFEKNLGVPFNPKAKLVILVSGWFATAYSDWNFHSLMANAFLKNGNVTFIVSDQFNQTL